jgi:hypothetical protein
LFLNFTNALVRVRWPGFIILLPGIPLRVITILAYWLQNQGWFFLLNGRLVWMVCCWRDRPHPASCHKLSCWGWDALHLCEIFTDICHQELLLQPSHPVGFRIIELIIRNQQKSESRAVFEFSQRGAIFMPDQEPRVNTLGQGRPKAIPFQRNGLNNKKNYAPADRLRKRLAQSTLGHGERGAGVKRL